MHCGQLPLDALAKKFGTPLYVYSADEILHRVSLFQKAFADRAHMVCFAVKSNSAVAILELIYQAGAGFDIVSGGELQRVLAVSPEAAKRVVFSGVAKEAWEMDLALDSDIHLFNVESEPELELLGERAKKKKKCARVSFRVNPDVFAETHPYISTGMREHKFGVDFATARRLYRRAAEHKWLEPYGVSVHIGSQIRSADPFGAAVGKIADLLSQLKKEGITLRAIDAGGGLGIEYQLGKKFDPTAEVQRYAKALKSSLKDLDVELLLEPGRFIVAQAGALLSRVVYIKKNGKKTFVITDAGMNDLIRPSLYQAHHEIVPVAPRGRAKKAVDVVGPICETGDFFARDRKLESVEQGELVAVLDAGAYGMTLSSNYNTRPRPAEILVKGKQVRQIRRRETIEDLLAVEEWAGQKKKR